MLLGSFEGLSGRRGPLGKLLGMKVLQRLVVAVPYVQERLDHLGEQLGAGADLLECERPGDSQRPGTAGELPQERVHAPTVDALVPLRPLADSDDAEVDLGVLWQQVCHQVGDTGSERGAGGITDPEPHGGVVPAVGHENEVALNALVPAPKEVGADADRVPDRGPAVGGQEGDEILDVREMVGLYRAEGDGHADGVGERDEPEGGPRTGPFVKDPVDRRAGHFDLLALAPGPLGVGQRREHALREVKEENVAFAYGGRTNRGAQLLHQVSVRVPGLAPRGQLRA